MSVAASKPENFHALSMAPVVACESSYQPNYGQRNIAPDPNGNCHVCHPVQMLQVRRHRRQASLSEHDRTETWLRLGSIY